MKKKLLSVVLALALCLGLATTALAAEDGTYEDDSIVISNVVKHEFKKTEEYGDMEFPYITCQAPVEFKLKDGANKDYIVELTITDKDGDDELFNFDTQDVVDWMEPGEYRVNLDFRDRKDPDGGLDFSVYYLTVVDENEAKTEDTKTEANNTETTTPSTDTGFADVAADDYYAEAVAWAVEQGITKGVSNTRFAPEETCTRAQIITFLWRAAAVEPGATAEITDVSSEDYYYDAVMWAKDLDMFEGNSFLPNDPCTRLTAVEFMWTAAKKPTAAASSFSDVKSDAVNWAVAAGVTTGTEPGKFSPNETCTRGQIVTFLWRAYAEAE